MFSKIGEFIVFKLLKWKFNYNNLTLPKKAVLIYAPHTSNWDFIIGRIILAYLGTKPKLLVKKGLFFPPLGWILKSIGGIPVDRSRKNNLIDFTSELFNNSETMHIIFTPEGTRSKVDKWKKGFYYTALQANVPIFLTYGDFKKKEGGFLEAFTPTGDIEKDILYIKSKYYNIKGKHPEKGVYPS